MQIANEAQAIAAGLTGLLGILMALFFAYFPGVKGKFEKLDSDRKGLIQVGLVLLVVVGQYVLDLAGAIDVYPDGWDGLFLAVSVLIAGLAGNQTIYATIIRPRKNSGGEDG